MPGRLHREAKRGYLRQRGPRRAEPAGLLRLVFAAGNDIGDLDDGLGEAGFSCQDLLERDRTHHSLIGGAPKRNRESAGR